MSDRLFRSIGVGVVFGLASMASRGVCGDDGEVPALPASIQRALAWLPPDTETLTAAQSFQLPSLEEPDGAGADLISQVLQLRLLIQLEALEGLFDLDKGKYFEPLAGSKVVVALRGARTFDVVSSFGSLRSEACSIIVFERNLDDVSKGWLGNLPTGS